ncbi:MAG: agmatinase [Butyrivibrio sp.]|nr:agmatinase [Butyrivibrio sp.]
MAKEYEPGFNTYKSLPYKADLKDCDYVVCGIGFDSATSGKPGTRFAPDAIRTCYWKGMGYNQNLKVETSVAQGTDYGNMTLKHGYILPSFHIITDEMRKFLEAGVIPVIIGGDHSITLPELRAMYEFYGPMALIHFDTHRDVRCTGTKYDHGNPFSRALEEGIISPEHSVQIGIRYSIHDVEYWNFGQKEGMKIIPASRMLDIGPDEVIKEIKEQVGDMPAFLTFDIDCLDPAAAPGTGTPRAGGPDTYFCRKVIREIGTALDIKGFDVVEVAPDIDIGGLTLQAADGLLVDMIGTIAKRKELGTLVRGSGKNLHPDNPKRTLEIEEENMKSDENSKGRPEATGIRTFCGLKAETDLENLKDLDAVLFGMPYDCATSNRPGTRFAPRALRKFWGFNPYSIEFGFNAHENFEARDFGDFNIYYNSINETMHSVTKQLDKILASTDAVTIGVGGDHALTFAELRSMEKKYGKMAFIHFDSHTDTWDAPDENGNCMINHGTPFRVAINQGSLDATHGIQVGLRSGGEHDHDFAREHGMTIVNAQTMHKIGIEETAKRIRETVGDKPCFVTFDIDFIDPAYAPGTGTPVIGGFTSSEALKLIRLALPGLNIKGMDLVEVAPQYDTGEITQYAAVQIISEFLTCLSYTKNVLHK